MRRGRYVSTRALADRLMFESDLKFEPPLPPGTCRNCEGSGTVLEQIDDDRLPVRVPCHMCREYCKSCAKWRKKGHKCPGRDAMHADAGLTARESQALRRLTDGR